MTCDMNKAPLSDHDESRPSDNLRLAEEIRALTFYLKKTNSFRHRFLMGMFWGIGGVLGATILAAPLILALSKLLAPLGLDISA